MIMPKEKKDLENNMNFYIKKKKESLVSLIRKVGYTLTPYSLTVKDEPNFIRPLSRNGYPRFHLYVKDNEEKISYLFSLHLDQKKVSYNKHTAHSGEYEGKVVEREAERIIKLLE